mgnify:CR=1 FL=1
MGHDNIILLFDSMLFFMLALMAVMLCLAARFRGEGTYAALLILGTTVSDFIYNICDHFGWSHIALIMAPVAYAANLTVMPLMLFLAHRAFNPYYEFRWKALLHFLPAILFALLIAVNICLMPPEVAETFTVERALGMPSLLTGINFAVMIIQLAVYFYRIFSYLRKAKHYIINNRSEAEMANKVWVPKFITLVGALGIVAMVWSVINPLGGFRLFYFINVVAMFFLIYSELKLANAFRKHRAPSHEIVNEVETDFIAVEVLPQATPETDSHKEEDLEQLQQYARQVEEYLRSSEAYINPNLSLRDVSKATGISTNNLSKSINTALGKNFFDLVNGFRVEKSKALLAEKKEKGLTLETVAELCGFNSQHTFCRAFKKQTGVSTNEWLKIFNKD